MFGFLLISYGTQLVWKTWFVVFWTAYSRCKGAEDEEWIFYLGLTFVYWLFEKGLTSWSVQLGIM